MNNNINNNLNSGNNIELKVKFNQTEDSFYCNSEMTVAEMVGKFYKEKNIDFQYQKISLYFKIMCNGVDLMQDDKKKLSEVGVVNGSVVEIVGGSVI